IGDTDGTCSASGCANGTYYLNFNIANQHAADPDPVVQLRTAFDAWRNAQLGRPDHIQSQKTLGASTLPGNGTSQTRLDLDLIDWAGNAVGHGGATVTVQPSAASAGPSTFGTPVDHGDGTYSVPVTAGIGQGTDEFVVVVDDGQGAVTLFPFPQLVIGPTLTA